LALVAALRWNSRRPTVGHVAQLGSDAGGVQRNR
jgi:hypothetical protein